MNLTQIKEDIFNSYDFPKAEHLALWVHQSFKNLTIEQINIFAKLRGTGFKMIVIRILEHVSLCAYSYSMK